MVLVVVVANLRWLNNIVVEQFFRGTMYSSFLRAIAGSCLENNLASANVFLLVVAALATFS